MLKVEDIKKELAGFGMTDTEINSIKGKESLLESLNNLKSLKSSSELIGEENSVVTQFDLEDENQETIPDYSSVEWEDYVMSKFTDDELVEGKFPKLGGLRRLAALLLGDIVVSRPVSTVLLPLTSNNDDPHAPYRATVTYELHIGWKLGLPAHLAGTDMRVFGGVGGSFVGNTDKLFAKYPECIAETRAEVRAYRKALRLSVAGADEIDGKIQEMLIKNHQQESVNPVPGEGKKISESQITAIKKVCERLNIDVEKYINMGTAKYADIKDIPYDTAQNMVVHLNKYQSNSADSKKIPLSILKGD